MSEPRLKDEGLEGKCTKSHEFITWYQNNQNDLACMDLLNVRETLTQLHAHACHLEAEVERLRGELAEAEMIKRSLYDENIRLQAMNDPSKLSGTTITWG